MSEGKPKVWYSVSEGREIVSAEEYRSVEGEIAHLRDRIRALEAENRSLSAQLFRHEGGTADYERKLTDCEEEIKRLDSRAEKAEAELQRLADEGLTLPEKDERFMKAEARVAEIYRQHLECCGRCVTEADALEHLTSYAPDEPPPGRDGEEC